MAVDLFFVFVAAVVSAALTWCFRNYALAKGRMDIPNQRSSHVTPTPRGGGVSIVAVLSGACLLVTGIEVVNVRALIGCGVAGLLVAAVGYVDDVRSLSAKSRFAVHTLAAGLLVFSVVGPDGAAAFFPGLPAYVVLALLIVGTIWSINLFNFMDGIDGIAASEAAFVSAAAAVLTLSAAGPSDWSRLALVLAAACVGFLLFNWAPAKIFLGDVGSGFMGFWLAALAVALHVSGYLPIWTYVILSSLFVADATTTLVARIARGERWYEPHRSHAYQVLSRRWRSHAKVTLLTIFVNVTVLFPLAYVSIIQRHAAHWIAVATLLALSGACWSIRRTEVENS
jgi:Fuc2NAc and GlcNAc transferase